jgi:hypothetical protein
VIDGRVRDGGALPSRSLPVEAPAQSFWTLSRSGRGRAEELGLGASREFGDRLVLPSEFWALAIRGSGAAALVRTVWSGLGCWGLGASRVIGAACAAVGVWGASELGAPCVAGTVFAAIGFMGRES